MAMTMSGRVPPARPRSGARRRRAPANEDEEAAATTVQRRPDARFAFLDDALDDSDQTITSAALGRPPRALAATRRRLELTQTTVITTSGVRTKSTFFPDSTDDEETGRGASVAPVMVRAETKDLAPRVEATAELPTFPVIHIGDVQFPMTRTVLWDRRVLAGPFHVQTVDVLPRIRIENVLLKQLHAMLMQDARSGTKVRSRLVGYLVGAASDELDKCVVFSHLDHHKPDDHKTFSTWVLPVYHGRSPYKEDQEQAQRDIIATSKSLYEATSGGAFKKTGRGMVPLLGEVIVQLAFGGSRAEMAVEFDLFAPIVSLEFNVIRSLPQLMTPLSASLLRCELGPDTLRFGFLTLDRARKAVPLLETDPLVLQRPIVGVWVYGVSVDDATTPNALCVDNPFLLQSCVRFLVSKIVKERAQVEPSTFLVALYPGNSPSGPLPRFFECRVKRPTNGQTDSSMVTWGATSGYSRCFAGVRSFKGDLELPLVLTSPSSTQVPPTGSEANATAPGEAIGVAFNGTSSKRPLDTTDGEPNITPSPLVHSDEVPSEETEPHSRPRLQSCCRSQQLLALHHQEILEQQQRQMKEMQEQIAHLQRVLSETREENARLLVEASSRYSGSSVGERDERQGDSRSVVELDQVEASKHDEDSQNNEKGDLLQDVEKEDSVISSLGLSSVSQQSNLSGLSSASLSFVGPRLRQILLANDSGSAGETNQATHDGYGVEEQPVIDTTDTEERQNRSAGHVIEPSVPVSMRESGGGEENKKPPACPCTPVVQRRVQKAHCERDEFEEDSAASRVDLLLAERLHIPDTPNREEIVRGGALPTFGFSHGSSFSIPKIKYVAEVVTVDSDDDEEEEIRQIEMKYRKRFVH